VKTEPRPRLSVGGWKMTIMTPLAQARGKRFRPAVCPLTATVGHMDRATRMRGALSTGMDRGVPPTRLKGTEWEIRFPNG
jgi:hypothetical protein